MAITYDPFGTPFDDGIAATAFDVPAESTALPGSLLDVGKEVFDIGKASLSKLLDIYAYREVAEINSMYSVPPGFQRVPGTNQIIPAGQVGKLVGSTISTSTLLLVGVVVAAFFFGRKG